MLNRSRPCVLAMKEGFRTEELPLPGQRYFNIAKGVLYKTQWRSRAAYLQVKLDQHMTFTCDEQLVPLCSFDVLAPSMARGPKKVNSLSPKLGTARFLRSRCPLQKIITQRPRKSAIALRNATI